MKKIILLFAIIFCVFEIDAQTCTPNTTYTQTGIYPDTLPSGTVGQAYSADITFVMPLDTQGFNFTNFQIITVSLPVGLNWTCNNFSNGCNYNPQVNQYGCVNITGTPLLAGSYPINVTVIADLTIASGIPVTFQIFMKVLPANSSASNNGFSMNGYEGCSPITVNFLNNNPGLLAYYWNFGNGNQSTLENPVPQVYNQPGDYYVHYEAYNDTTTNNFYTITSISITSIQNSASVWGYPIDANPDLFVVVKENGTTVYQSNFNADTYPVVSWTGLNINMNPASTYVLEVWDEDNSEFGFGANDFVGNHTMSLNGCVGCAANISVVNYNVNHLIIPPSPSVFTNDTVHVYGYPGKPNIYYDSINHTLHTDSIQYNLQWYLNGSPQLGQNAGTDTVFISGDYFVIAVNASGCTTFSDTVTAIYCDPLYRPHVIKTGAQLSTIDTTGNTMQWYLNGNIMPGETGDILITTANGVYTLQIVNSFGCQFTSLPVTISVGIEEFENLTANVYPNPAENFITISTPSDFVISKIEILDLSGRVIKSVRANSNSEVVSLSTIADGLYFIDVISGIKTVRKSLVIAR